MLWYRGHEDQNYKLLPSLYRNTVVDFNGDKGYNSIHYAEDVRMQQYYARNYQFIKDNGINTIEWLGIAQHFGIKTRFLDWSTSAIHALIFSLDQYFDINAKPSTKIPCVWLLKPQLVNKHIIESTLDNIDDLINYINNTSQSNDETKTILSLINDIKNNRNTIKNVFQESNPQNNWQSLDYIYDLAYFDRILEIAKSNPKLAFSENVLNPIYYILAKAYIDGDTFGNQTLSSTPLAIIHPINNERIKSQNGVFTIFPFPSKRIYDKKNKLENMKMELNNEIKGTLCKIVLTNPYGISEELKTLGVRKSWLFYEQDYISREIENSL